MKLSHTMAETLGYLQQNDGWNAVPYENKTMNALQRRGLVRWYPYGKAIDNGIVHRGIWKLTKEGRQEVCNRL